MARSGRRIESWVYASEDGDTRPWAVVGRVATVGIFGSDIMVDAVDRNPKGSAGASVTIA